MLAYGSSPSYSLVITAKDEEFNDEMTMQIFLADVNESPQFPDGISFSEFENCCSSATSCPENPSDDDRTFTSNDFTAFDPEGPKTVISYTVQSSLDDGGKEYNLNAVQISKNTYTLRSSSTKKIDYEEAGTTKVITVVLIVKDNKYTKTCECDITAGITGCSNALSFCDNASTDATGQISVTIKDVNEAVTSIDTLAKTTLEGAVEGEEVVPASTGNNGGAPYSIVDVDVGQTYTYTFGDSTSDNAKALFNLDSLNGKITTKVGTCEEAGTSWPCLDYFDDATAQNDLTKWKASYVMYVDVTDSMAPTTTTTTEVTVTIGNTDERPMVIQVFDDHMDHSHSFAVDEDSTQSDWSQQLRALDPDTKGSEKIDVGTQVTPGSYAYITTTPGSWTLKDGANYVLEVPNQPDTTTVQFDLSSSGMLGIAGTALLDFETAPTYNVEVAYSNLGLWLLNIPSSTLEKDQGVSVTQSGGVAGILVKALTGAGMTQVVVSAGSGIIFDTTKDLVIGGTSVTAATGECVDENSISVPEITTSSACAGTNAWIAAVNTAINALESEKRVMYIQLKDVNEAPVLLPKVVMTEEDDDNNWYLLSQHKALTASDCAGTASSPLTSLHYCNTGQCVFPNGDVTDDYCNSDSQCGGSTLTCQPKIIKNNAFLATDVDVDSTLTYSVVEVSHATTSSPTWTASTNTIMAINVNSGAMLTTMHEDGAGSELQELSTKYKVQVQVTDEGTDGKGTGGDDAYRSETAGKWGPLTSAVVTVYFRTIETNAFPVFSPTNTLELSIREDAADGFTIDTAISASDENGDSVYWDLGRFDNGQKSFPTMSDNTGAGITPSLSGDKFTFISAENPTTNKLQLVGEGINFERGSLPDGTPKPWPAGTIKPIVQVEASIEDGRGGYATQKINITVIDVNEEPFWKRSVAGYSITVDEDADISSTKFSPETGGLLNFQADDVDEFDTQTYTIDSIFAGTIDKPGIFTIDPTTRVISLAQALDYETITSYTMTVRVTDRGSYLRRVGSVLFAQTTVQVKIIDVNEQPVMSSSSMTQPESQTNFFFRFELNSLTSDVDEGRTQFTWTKTSESPESQDLFEVNAATGLLKLKEDQLTLDFENAEIHVISMEVADGWKKMYDAASSQQQTTMKSGPALTAQATYTINVTDVDDIGVPALNNSNYLFSTAGGETVVLIAKNLGPTDFKCGGSGGSCDENSASYVVTYGPATASGTPLKYTATDCVRVVGQDNKQLSCKTVPGVGYWHEWEISVTYNGVTTVSERSTTRSAYKKPTLATVANSKNIPTVGGTLLTFNGFNMGPVSTIADVYYISNTGAIDITYPASACTVTVANTRVECTASPGVGTNLKYCLSVGGQYAESWCTTYVEGEQAPNDVLHLIEPGTGTTVLLINKQTISATQSMVVRQGDKTGTLKTTLSSDTESTVVEITSADNVYFNTLEDIVIVTAPTTTTIVAANINNVKNGGVSSYALPSITQIEGKSYNKIFSTSDGATSSSGIPRINAVMEVHLLEPMLTQDILITPLSDVEPMVGGFKITYGGFSSDSCLNVTTMSDADIMNGIISALTKSNIDQAASKIKSVVSEEYSVSGVSRLGTWINIRMEPTFTEVGEIGVTQLGCRATSGLALTSNTASWGKNAWGTNGESGAYFILGIPSGCEYCKERDQQITGKIYPGKTAGNGSLKYELEALPGIGADMIDVVRTKGTVGEGYVWTVTFSGANVMGNIPAFTIEHTIDASDILPRARNRRHRVEMGVLSIGTEQKLTSKLTVVGRLGGLRARGGESFDVLGQNFGPQGTPVFLYYGPTADAQRYTATQCDVILHTKMQCISAGGVGKDHVSLVKAGGQLSSTEFSNTRIFYQPPTVMSVGGSGASASTTAGGATIIITGSGFGPKFVLYSLPCTYESSAISTQKAVSYLAAGAAAHYGQLPKDEIKVGETYGAECCVVESDERMVCKTTRGTGFDHHWMVRIGKQW